MRINQELKLPKTPHSLWVSNKSLQDIHDLFSAENESIISPETCSHRHQQGWQHFQDVPVQNNLNNNNVNLTNITNININNNPDEAVILASSSPHKIDGNSCSADFEEIQDFQPQHNNDDDSDDTSSGDDEDSSISFSDTSPLLDVSSLDEDSSSSSSSSDDSDDDEDDTDMDDDDMPIDKDFDDNVDDGFEEEEDHGCSMDTSWMSISSVASTDVPAFIDNKTQVFDFHRERNGVILPDVLPVSVSKAKIEEVSPEGVKNAVDATLREITLRVKKRSELKLDPVPRLLSRDCCIVEITTQPDIQVDIRLNPTSSSAIPNLETDLSRGCTYTSCEIEAPDMITKSCVPSIKNSVDSSEIHCTTEIPTYQSNSLRENHSSSKYGLGEGVRLNNFSIVNGFKAVSLTDIVKTDDEYSPETSSNKNEKSNDILTKESSSESLIKESEDTSFASSRADRTTGCFNIYSKENRRHYRDYTALEQRPCLDVSKPCSYVSTQGNKSVASDSYIHNPKSTQCANSNVLSQSKRNNQGTKTNDTTPSIIKKKNTVMTSSPEHYEVYTMETAVPHINWTATNKSNKDSDWLKKRKNDREEIRKKLAMDSDNEDYVAEKMVENQENDSIDRLKSGNNLQICFMNEAAKEIETLPETEPTKEQLIEKVKKPLPKLLMSSLLFPPSFQKSLGASKVQNNNNTSSPVIKRQRPTFFFNRPRSWHAAKPEEKHDPEEDLFTRHHKLQVEAWEALAQAKDMARMQMEIERQKKKKSPIAEIVGITFPDGQNILSRHALLDMNVAQLQVIVNDLHSQIETLNENLVKFLLERDDLHMEQDSMLVDIEDLTRYLGLKGESSVTQSMDSKLARNVNSSPTKNLNSESVRRSQSVHLKKTKRNFM